MRVLYFQGLGGASGDMILGAFASLGVDLKAVESSIRDLAVEPIRFSIEPAEQRGLTGVRVHVDVDASGAASGGGERHLSDIRSILEGSGLPTEVIAMSLEVFERLALAEATVHGIEIEAVHFHEIGALDSIADIVAGCIALREIGADAVCVAPLPLGRGTVECAHGTYPVPAPATVELLKNFPIVQTDEEQELVTPTGAALLTTWHSMDLPPPGSEIRKVGYGFGRRTLTRRPNALRAMLLECGSGQIGSACLVLECQMDDTSPELIAECTRQLLEAGALDVYTTSVQMKKQRPGTLITVLCDLSMREQLIDVVFRETTTFGVREYLTSRTMLQRRTEVVATSFGDVRIKVGIRNGETVTRSPEFEDCMALAKQHNVPVRRVFEAAQVAAAGMRED